MIRRYIGIFFGLLLPLSASQAAWQLEANQSWLSFLSIKKEHVAELGQFRSLGGSITDAGEATIKIDLASVDTAIEIRDERMQKLLFDTATYSHATLSAQLEMEKIAALEVGKTLLYPLTAILALHGQEQSLTIPLVIAKLTENTVLVVNQTLFALDASQFDLVAGIEKLKEIVELPSISQTIPVSFVFTFTQTSS